MQTFFLQGSRDIALPRLGLIMAVAVLTVMGIVMVYSSSTIEAISNDASPTSYMVSQALYAAVSVAACIFVARVIPYYYWMSRLLDVAFLVSLGLLVLTAAIGTIGLGAQRWLTLGPVSFQPSELSKVVFVLAMSRIMYQMRTQNMDANALGLQIGIYIIVPLVLIYTTQSDLGTTLICTVGILAVAWLADMPLRPFVIAIVVLLALGVIAVFGVGYRSDRLIFLDPESDYYGTGYQLSRSFYAFGEGSLFGVGLGNSTEKYLYLPEAETDFIFAIIGEELGLVGALFVIAMFLVILYCGMQIARKAPDMFGSMIAGGCTVMLVFQALLNICCVVGLLPTTGKPLPFLSSGGSALLGAFLLVGVILSVSFASGADSGVYRKRREEFTVLRSGGAKPGPGRGPAPKRGSRSRGASSSSRSRRR
jgi:cell division protein FtsW